VRAGDPHEVGIAVNPLERDDQRGRAEAREPRRPVGLAEGDDRIVDGHRRDRQLLPLRVRDADPDLTRLELDPTYVELIRRWRGATDKIE
jgi:hypothetical protein